LASCIQRPGFVVVAGFFIGLFFAPAAFFAIMLSSHPGGPNVLASQAAVAAGDADR
jgi:hypothetical protein